MKSNPWNLDLYRRHRTALIDYVTPMVGCRARAEDLVQDAFMRYSARQGTVTSAARAEPSITYPVSYLYRIVRNLALDWVRRATDRGETTDDTALESVPAPTATPEQTALDRDRLRVLAEALAELPERTRIAFEMYRLEGLSLQQVADHLEVSVVRAHQLVKDALRHCAGRLEAGDS